jgi:hypothetical protein
MFSTSSNKDLGGFNIIISQLLFIIRKKYWKGLLLFIGFFMTWVALMLYGIFSDNKKTELIKSDMGLVEGIITYKGAGNAKGQGATYGVDFIVNNKKYRNYFDDNSEDFIGLKVIVAYNKDSVEVNEVLNNTTEFERLGLDYNKYMSYLKVLDNAPPETFLEKFFNVIIQVCVFGVILGFVFYKIYLALRADLEELNRDGGV